MSWPRFNLLRLALLLGCLVCAAHVPARASARPSGPPAAVETARGVSQPAGGESGDARNVEPTLAPAATLPPLATREKLDASLPPLTPPQLLSGAKTTDAALESPALPVVSASVLAALAEPLPAQAPQAPPSCARTIKADVVAFDQVFTYNRFGAFNPAGMLYALTRDVMPISGSQLSPGNVRLKPEKRPRPIVLRANEGDCLEVRFTNLLTPTRAGVENIPNPPNTPNRPPFYDKPPFFMPMEGQTSFDGSQFKLRTMPNGTVQVIDEMGAVVEDGNVRLRQNDTTATRAASMHVNGLDYVDSMASDGANVGLNATSLAEPGQTKTYRWYAAKQGQYLVYSMGAPAGGEGDGGQPVLGLFGSINVEPMNAKWYRSQVTAAQLAAVRIGVNRNGTPKIDYEKTDASGTPILNMLNANNEIVHSDINAIITGFVENCVKAPPSSTCGQPFREFSVLFHDEIKAVQAFPELEQELFHGVRDGFAINYGSGSLGAIVLANRKKVGPAKDCGECKFEEFFLESWVQGDPALLVRRDASGQAVEALYPDDPSNVHHSYLGDPVRFRNIHMGPKETHVFHLHAHQWLQSPRDENSTYLDSQTISPGASYTYEINYGGSGNRNFTPGDAIFHCHLYPHFAQGMWELWRVHDTFEQGTPDRNLPDAEIAGGTPNPAIIPLPDKAMPPMPTNDFKGYPFYIAAQKGHRPPQPPLDMEQDGGLPRHRILQAQVVDGRAAIEPELLEDPVAARVLQQNGDPNLLAFARKLISAQLELLPSGGTPDEQTAMRFHEGMLPDVTVDTPYPCETCSPPPPCATCIPLASDPAAAPVESGTVTVESGTVAAEAAPQTSRFAAPMMADPVPPVAVPVITQYQWPARGYLSYTATGQPGLFLVNGQTRKPGAPFADPCHPAAPLRKYRTAYIQFDMPVNRAGWHDRQARITTLEDDVTPTFNGTRAPEPLFFRANSLDCVDFRATNLVPSVLNLDDFQIFTPTDTIGQHIHLVKFDVTSSDGAGNGWNYEDGTFSPGEVQERIEAHNNFREAHGQSPNLTPRVNPKFGPGPDLDGNGVGDFVGAQTTVQRWWADPLINNEGQDRTIRTVFTHDHFGPSSHQHHGLYGALVVEPTASQWTDANGVPLGARPDGGPTSFAANIIHPNPMRSYREFNLAFADFAIVYTPDLVPVNPPGRKEAPLPIAIEPTPIPQPEAISAADPGTQLINYRNEPIPLRVGQRNAQGQFVQKPGDAGDLADAFSSLQHGDPFTPILQAIEGDRVQIRLIQGAQEEQHVFNLHGNKWLFEPSAPDSGYRNGQQIGISEHFEFVLDRLPTPPPALGSINFRDFMYSSAATDNLWDGQWGLMRVFRKESIAGTVGGVLPDGIVPPRPIPSNPITDPISIQTPEPQEVCPAVAPVRQFAVSAILARDLLPDGTLVYNERFDLKDPNAILFIEDEDEAALRSGARQPEPLILRAAAGDCIRLRLRNRLPVVPPENDSWNTMPMIVNNFNFNQVRESNRVGLHPQLVSYDPLVHDGAHVGRNFDSTVRPGGVVDYVWYAGDRKFDEQTGEPIPTPIEFGATGLRDMGDAIKHASHAATGALIIEPLGSTWVADPNSKASASVRNAAGQTMFREFVVIYQDDLSLQTDRPQPCNEGTTAKALCNIGEEDDSEDTGMKAFNYRTEPLWGRLGLNIADVPDALNDKDQRNVLSSNKPNPGCNGGACGDPATPVFTATAGTPVRFRVLHGAGHPRQHGFTVFGHHWQFEPWTANSTMQGTNPFTFEIGSESGIGPTRHANLLTTAGGLFKVPGDYLYRTQESFQFGGGGLWGIFRVTPN